MATLDIVTPENESLSLNVLEQFPTGGLTYAALERAADTTLIVRVVDEKAVQITSMDEFRAARTAYSALMNSRAPEGEKPVVRGMVTYTPNF